MRDLISSILLKLMLVAVLATTARGAGAFDQANDLYAKGEFQAARDAYAALADAGGASANVYYNLGNADYRLGRNSDAVLAFERALALDPSHPEARANLDLIRSQNGARVEQSVWWQRIVEWPDTTTNYRAAWGAAVGFWVLLFSLAPVIWRRRVAWIPAAFGFLLLAWCGTAVAWRANQGALWLVTVKNGIARVAPAESSESAGSLPMGSQVRLLLDRGEWLFVKLPDQTRAWISRAALQPVAPIKS